MANYKIPYIGYGVLGMPIAMVALPIYVHIPSFYGNLGLSIGTIGLILLCLRLFDAVQDPLIGYFGDRFKHATLGRKIYIYGASPILAIGFCALFNPITSTNLGHACWLIISLTVIYTSFSVLYINYLALGTEIGKNYNDHTKIAASRACFGIFGVAIALILPELISLKTKDPQSSLFWFSVAFVPILFVSLFSLKSSIPLAPLTTSANGSIFEALYSPLKEKKFRILVIIFMFSGIGSAIPGLLIIFYVQDVLKAGHLTWLFILVYFASSGIFIPAWVKISRKLGKKVSWQLGMFLAITSFSFTFFLQSGDTFYFVVICVISGIANGADLTLPFSILSDQIKSVPKGDTPQVNSGYFGFWQLVEKVNLALAAGLALPLLGFFEYEPSTISSNTEPLKFMYAILPCVLKILALTTLARFTKKLSKD